ncbi:MAG: hypothetical protein HY650_05195 [Acidobacteria bacterium]|nr:hypothetical protein [Acidobacteriota bacterium]
MSTGPSTFVPMTSIQDLAPVRQKAHATDRLAEIRRLAPGFKERFAASGQVLAVQTFDLISLPYPSRYGLLNAVRAISPFMLITNRMLLIQFQQFGRIKNLLMEPSDVDFGHATPFFKRMSDRYGDLVSRHVLSTRHGTVREHLLRVGIAPDEIDYVTFDHLHTQDIRSWMGTTRPIAGRSDRPLEPYFPNATFILQRREIETYQHLHPLQADWYIEDGMKDVRTDRLLIVDGDYYLGEGVALLATPGHTMGNHSLVLNTEKGVYVISENGISADNYSPLESEIAGVRKHVRATGAEVVLNGNTLESPMDQYSSMVLEKLIADVNHLNPRFVNVFPSSELTGTWIYPGLSPTFAHTAITCGELHRPARTYRVAS